jgi:aminoglycoside 3'-phosphotransferase II
VEDNQGTPIQIGKSGAKVVLVQPPDGPPWIEKSSLSRELEREVAILKWCAGRLPVPKVIAHAPGSVVMSVLPGVILADLPARTAVSVIVQALNLVHSLPIAECPFDASWESRLKQGEENILAGLIDESDFDDDNVGRSPSDILAELRSLPPLPELGCFTHGDACLPNFLGQNGELTGIVDLGRAGIAHPAQDWALALRSARGNFGSLGEQLLREHLPTHSADEEVLRRFRLLDELF